MATPAFVKDFRAIVGRYVEDGGGGGLRRFREIFDDMEFDYIHWAHASGGLKLPEHVTMLLHAASRLVQQPELAFASEVEILFVTSHSRVRCAALFLLYALFQSQPARDTGEQVHIRLDSATWQLLIALIDDVSLTVFESQSAKAILKYLVQEKALVAVHQTRPAVSLPTSLLPKRNRTVVSKLVPAVVQENVAQPTERQLLAERRFAESQRLVKKPLLNQQLVESSLRKYRVAKASLRQSVKTLDVSVPRMVTGGVVIDIRALQRKQAKN